jgi:hypothetical protein
LDNMFKVAEINRRTEEAVDREKEKKSWVEYHARQEATLPIVDRLKNVLENNVAQVTSKELEMLLRWKGVPVSKMGNNANRRLIYQQFAEGGAEEASIPAPWTEIYQAEQDVLRNSPIKLSNTAYRWFEEQNKRVVGQTYAKMSAKEKETLKRRMAEINEAGAGDKESTPPSLTPV